LRPVEAAAAFVKVTVIHKGTYTQIYQSPDCDTVTSVILYEDLRKESRFSDP